MDRFRSILYIETHPRGSGRGFSCALTVAAAHGAELTVLHVVTPPSIASVVAPGGAELRARTLRRRRALLAHLIDRGDAREVPTTVRVVSGETVDAALARVEEDGHDLVMKVAADDDPIRAWAARRRDRRLIRRAPCPVWLLDPAQHGGFRSVMAAVDVSDGRSESMNRAILRRAAAVADASGAALHVVHAWSVVGEPVLADPLIGVSRPRLRGLVRETERLRREAVESLVESTLPGRDVTIALRKGRALPTLRSLARRCEADVVVVGNSGLDGLGRLFLANLGERLVGTIPGSVLVLREPAPETAPSPVVRLAAAGHAAVPATFEVAMALTGTGIA